MSFLAILGTLNFGNLSLERCSNLLKWKFRTSKIAKNDIFGLFEFTKIWFHIKWVWRKYYQISTKSILNFTFWKFLEHSSFVLESRRVTDLDWEPCKVSPYNNCFSMAPNGSRVPNYNVQVMKVNDAAYLRHHLVNYLQPLLESWSGQRNVFDSIMHLELGKIGKW